jgi:hypothetical protein
MRGTAEERTATLTRDEIALVNWVKAQAEAEQVLGIDGQPAKVNAVVAVIPSDTWFSCVRRRRRRRVKSDG